MCRSSTRTRTAKRDLDCGGVFALPPLSIGSWAITKSGGDAKTPPQSKYSIARHRGRRPVLASFNTRSGHHCSDAFIDCQSKVLYTEWWLKRAACRDSVGGIGV